MPNKYEFDMERNMVMCVDEIQRLRAENDTLRKESEFYRKQCDMRDEWRDKIEAELAALKEAARQVVNACHAADADGELDDRIDGQALFELARLVGEE